MSWGANMHAVWKVPGLSTAHKAVLAYIATRADSDGANSHPSYDTIAEAVGCGERRAIKIVADLIAAGLIRRQPRYRPTGQQTSNTFALVVPTLLQKAAETDPVSDAGGVISRSPQLSHGAYQGGGSPDHPRGDPQITPGVIPRSPLFFPCTYQVPEERTAAHAPPSPPSQPLTKNPDPPTTVTRNTQIGAKVRPRIMRVLTRVVHSVLDGYPAELPGYVDMKEDVKRAVARLRGFEELEPDMVGAALESALVQRHRSGPRARVHPAASRRWR